MYWILGGLNVLMWGTIAVIFTAKVRGIGALHQTMEKMDGEQPMISVIIAARNEQKALERCIKSLINQTYPRLEVIVVNDRSDDSTGEIIARLEGTYSNVKGIEISELPEQWMGKSHALLQGTKQAQGDWLLFTDADILFHPHCIAKAVTYTEQHGLDHLTMIPDFEGPHVFSKWYAAFIFMSASSFGQLWKIKDPKSPQSLGVGAFNFVKRDVYEQIGTHAEFSYITTDDAALGKRVKQAGYRQDAIYGTRMIGVWNWYESLKQLIGSVEKSVFSYKNAIITTISCLLTMIYPWIGLFMGPVSARILCAVSLLSVFWLYFIYSRHSGSGFWYGIAHPFVGLFLIMGGLRGAFNANRSGGMTWRGTTYDRTNLKA
ncbi:glycosyltransferase family 2 protein [Paenibacillus dokdonensis]|uniref:4,4'-diaponeurosporenoate glycosyltransferase n=1 Tax=Paenibacillus dokdonensis TaxID=2567944 RepID=A0ABU6GT74_9BACL|nr:glycosyltransferase family 2 protein [Paenibacillus dokdonensis]MEC0242564.1 glycosyltransferase family 2 protein [Paenibacillus dokdonensis]